MYVLGIQLPVNNSYLTLAHFSTICRPASLWLICRNEVPGPYHNPPLLDSAHEMYRCLDFVKLQTRATLGKLLYPLCPCASFLLGLPSFVTAIFRAGRLSFLLGCKLSEIWGTPTATANSTTCHTRAKIYFSLKLSPRRGSTLSFIIHRAHRTGNSAIESGIGCTEEDTEKP